MSFDLSKLAGRPVIGNGLPDLAQYPSRSALEFSPAEKTFIDSVKPDSNRKTEFDYINGVNRFADTGFPVNPADTAKILKPYKSFPILGMQIPPQTSISNNSKMGFNLRGALSAVSTVVNTVKNVATSDVGKIAIGGALLASGAGPLAIAGVGLAQKLASSPVANVAIDVVKNLPASDGSGAPASGGTGAQNMGTGSGFPPNGDSNNSPAYGSGRGFFGSILAFLKRLFGGN